MNGEAYKMKECEGRGRRKRRGQGRKTKQTELIGTVTDFDQSVARWLNTEGMQ